MKILHIISKFAGGGLERRAIQTVKGLCSQPEIEQRIIVYSKEIEYKEVLSLDVEILYIVEKGRKRRCRKLRNAIEDFRPDIIHSWLDRFPTEQLFLSVNKRKYGYKYIHGAVCDANRINKISTVWLAQKISFICADVVVSNSKAGLIAKNAPLNKSKIIYNGFDFARIPQTVNQEKKRELGIITQFVVTMCGRVDGSKDWNSFIEIARLSKRNGLDATFVAVGNGSLLNYYINETKEMEIDNIIFTGRRTDVEEIIDISDVCILLSTLQKHAEGVSNFIMESMASEKPVIATNGGGTPEIISDGICGYLVNDNVKDTISQLNYLLKNNEIRKTMGKKAKEEVQNRFTLGQMTDNYLKLYQTLTN